MPTNSKGQNKWEETITWFLFTSKFQRLHNELSFELC